MNLFRLKNANSTNLKLNKRALVLVKWALACVAVFFAGTTPAVAGDQVPFKGRVSGQIPADFLSHVVPGNPCLLNFVVSNSGNATQLGHFTGQAEFKPNLCDGSFTGTFRWIAANGDEISGPFFGQLIPTTTPGVFDNIETALVTGGTGRFIGATGMFTLHGQVNFNTLSFVLPWQGTISSVGSNIKQ